MRKQEQPQKELKHSNKNKKKRNTTQEKTKKKRTPSEKKTHPKRKKKHPENGQGEHTLLAEKSQSATTIKHSEDENPAAADGGNAGH